MHAESVDDANAVVRLLALYLHFVTTNTLAEEGATPAASWVRTTQAILSFSNAVSGEGWLVVPGGDLTVGMPGWSISIG